MIAHTRVSDAFGIHASLRYLHTTTQALEEVALTNWKLALFEVLDCPRKLILVQETVPILVVPHDHCAHPTLGRRGGQGVELQFQPTPMRNDPELVKRPREATRVCEGSMAHRADPQARIRSA